MDPLKLLSRSTKLSRPSNSKAKHSTPSSGQNAAPQLFPDIEHSHQSTARKRKRGASAPNESAELNFFGTSSARVSNGATPNVVAQQTCAESVLDQAQETGTVNTAAAVNAITQDEAKTLLHKHKLKITWLNPVSLQTEERRKRKDKKPSTDVGGKMSIYPPPIRSFSDLRTQHGLSSQLMLNIDEQGYSVPTEVQMAALPLLLGDPSMTFGAEASPPAKTSTLGLDLMTIAPTGSGKTLAFMIPLLREISICRRSEKERAVSAIILAPTKELVGQLVNEGRKLSRGTGVTISQFRKGMRVSATVPKDDQRPKDEMLIKSDILVSTPGILATCLEGIGHDEQALSKVQHLVLDEADVLLDPLFRQQTLAIWNVLPNPALRVSLWSATMGSNVEELARSTIQSRAIGFGGNEDLHHAEAPIVRLVVGLKDSAIPNVKHKLVYAASEQGKLMGLRQLLHPSTTSEDALLPPFLVFTQTIERAVALHSELLYDIPAEAGGISRIAVLHSDLSDKARDSIMTRFRKGEVWILITTDLLSRGVDFRGVNGVVNYDIPTTSAAYVHRVGRTGRAGREGGVAVTLYSKEDIPFLKPIANLISAAQKLRGTSDTDDIQPWLLQSLPSLSKKSKQDLKVKGIESRTARGREKDPKAARKARISTKAGYLRREENRRKGAIQGSRLRREATVSDEDEIEFGGFD